MSFRQQRGVTLIEMVIVVALLGVMVGITFPAVSSGIDSIRIASASDSVASHLNSALNYANRRQEPVLIEFSVVEDSMRVRGAQPGFDKTLEMPDGVDIRSILPPIPADLNTPRRFMVYPGGTVPRLGVELVNRRGARRVVRIDPITGVPQIERGVAQ